MSENDRVEQSVKEIIYGILHDRYEMDSLMAGEVTNQIYEGIWEYIGDYD